MSIRNLHYAVLGKDDDTGVTYAQPQRLIGAVSANVKPSSSQETQYADDGPFDVANALGDITVDLELAKLTLKDQALLQGHKYEAGVMIQKASDEAPYVALGFMSRTRTGKFRFVWLFKGKFALKEDDYSTEEDKPKFDTPKLSATFVKRTFDEEWQRVADANDTGFVGAEDWFKSVPGSTLAEPEPEAEG